MTTLRRFSCDVFFKFNGVNLDPLTATYNTSFYLHYASNWPNFMTVAEAPDGSSMGYVIGKAEGEGHEWHGHVTAVTIAPDYRRLGLANKLMDLLERVSDQVYKGFFVDLYVRASNYVAIDMYKKLGYVVYRRVLGYYSGNEDGLDMRKSCSRDPEKLSERPFGRDVEPWEVS